MSRCRCRQCICRLSEKLPCEKAAGGRGFIGTLEIALPFYPTPSLLREAFMVPKICCPLFVPHVLWEFFSEWFLEILLFDPAPLIRT